MNNGFFLSLFNRFGLYYGFIDNDLKIHFENEDVYSFLSIDKGSGEFNLRDIFPEVSGSEDNILKVISGKKREYSIIGINRHDESERIFNLYFLHHTHNEYEAIAVIKDVTNETLFRQSLQQSTKEVAQLKNELIEKNRDLDETNKELIRSRDEMKILNLELEEAVRLRTLQLKEKSGFSK